MKKKKNKLNKVIVVNGMNLEEMEDWQMNEASFRFHWKLVAAPRVSLCRQIIENRHKKTFG